MIAKFYPKKFTRWELGQRLYDHYNEEYFGNKLPVVHVGFYKPGKSLTMGFTFRTQGARHASHITLNPIFKKFTCVLCATLLHEMIHVKDSCKGGHGPRFKRELRRLILAGAFNELL